MKSSFALVSLLFLPDAFAIAVPHVPKLVSKRFPRPAQFLPGENAHEKRETLEGQEEVSNHFALRDEIAELAPRAKQDVKSDIPVDYGLAARRYPDLEPRQPRGRPLVVARATPSLSSPSTTSSGGGIITPGPGHLPPDPQQQAHNSIVGGHPFFGHGPVVNVNDAGTNSSNSSDGVQNLTVIVPIGSATVAPIQNATAVVYETPSTSPCPPQPAREYIDSNGNFLPPDQQPGYNGSISTNGTVPGNCSANTVPEIVEEVVIEGHVDGDIEVVEIDIIPVNGTTAANGTASASLISAVGPTIMGTPSSTGHPPGGTGTGTRQRVVPVGFTGP